MRLIYVSNYKKVVALQESGITMLAFFILLNKLQQEGVEGIRK